VSALGEASRWLLKDRQRRFDRVLGVGILGMGVRERLFADTSMGSPQCETLVSALACEIVALKVSSILE
jgi:hypothetical protein